jgi:sugar phosphate isomerase/epimerase
LIKLSLQSLCYRDTFIAGKITMLEIIDRAYELKMDGVDLNSTHFASTDDDYLEKVKLACLERGLHMCYIGVSNDFGKTGDELREQIDLMKKWIDVAARMGIPMVRAFGSWLTDGKSEESAWPRLIESTREVTEYARSNGVVIGLHNHNHDCIPATGDQVIRMLDDVGSPYYTHILDTGQYLGSPGVPGGERGKEGDEGDLYESIEMTAPRAVHIRAKIYRIAGGEEAWLDYDRIMLILKKVGFNGWMSIVYEGQDELDEPAAVPLANKYMRSLLAKHEM